MYIEDIVKVKEKYQDQIDDIESKVQQSLKQTAFYTDQLLELRKKFELEVSQLK